VLIIYYPECDQMPKNGTAVRGFGKETEKREVTYFQDTVAAFACIHCLKYDNYYPGLPFFRSRFEFESRRVTKLYLKPGEISRIRVV